MTADTPTPDKTTTMEELARHGYYLLVSTLQSEQPSGGAGLRLLQERRVDGAILAGPEMPPRHILALRARGMPLVLVDNALPHTPIDCVLSEDEPGGYLATTHLLGHGHRAIAMLAGPRHWPSNQARARGYRRALAEAGLEPLEIHEEETTLESGYRAMQAALARFPGLRAVFAVNDSMAIGAMRAVSAGGRAVPADVAVVGFDDIEWATYAQPPLTTVKIHKQQMGMVAARRLVALLHNQQEPPVRSTVATRLIPRASCGCS